MLKSLSNNSSYYRLITLWVLGEAMVGGIIHGFHIPVSGLVVGSFAVICISMIGWYYPAKGAILRATIVVAIFKMILSPQAPVTAYVAVFFQGLLGELVFWNRRYYTVSCFVLALLALLESALQRILMLTIIYGTDIWKAINEMLNKLTGQKEWTNYSRWLILGYVVLHILMGILVGWICSVLPKKIKKWSAEKNPLYLADENNLGSLKPGRKGRSASFFIIWLVLLMIYLQSYLKIGTPLLPENLPLKIFLRSLIIILSWVVLVGPLLTRLLHSWLKKKKEGAQAEVQAVLSLLPTMRALVSGSWKNAAAYTGWKKYKEAFKGMLVGTLSFTQPKNIFVLTAPIGSGKTTSLLNWTRDRKDVHGILSPVIDGNRMFMDIQSKEQFPMIADPEEQDVLSVGRYIFSKASFAKAGAIIGSAIDKPGWLIIDEVGPLELRGEGLSEIVRKVLNNREGNTLLVIREGLAEKLGVFYQAPFIIIKDISELPKEKPYQ